jgi:hypothetical protein
MSIITEISKKINDSIQEGTLVLTGQSKRVLMGILSLSIGRGGQSKVAVALGASRMTVRKGAKEAASGEVKKDAFNERGRKEATECLPNLKADIKAIVDAQSQIDPKFQSNRIYTRLTGIEIRKQLIKNGKYNDEILPTERTIRNITNKLGYTLRKIKKTKPPKKTPETDAIFAQLKVEHERAANEEETVRISIDTKDRVKIGTFARGGRSRANIKASDHDFGDEYIVPFGILDIKEGKVFIPMSTTKATADFMVDRIEEYWIRQGYDKTKKVILINADNGTENNSRRTQFIKRLIEFSIEYNVEVRLAYYPPYHSKYNPIERVWGFLETHWSGDLIDSVETAMRYVKSFRYKRRPPEVALIDEVYSNGISVIKKTMKIYESVIERMEGLEDYFVVINPTKCIEKLAFFELYG